MKNRLWAWAALSLCLLLLLPLAAAAAENPDPVHENRLTISFRDNGTSLTGAEFKLYRVASMDSDGKLTVTETFSRYPVDFGTWDEETLRILAATLEGYVLRDGLTPFWSGKTDANGIIALRDLPIGLYLVLGSNHTQDGWVYETVPFMVELPSRDAETGEWLYDVVVQPKLSKRPVQEGGTLTRKVLKVWADDGNQQNRPKEITVQLLRDGVVWDTVTLNAENRWRHTWADLDDRYHWVVVESTPENYTVEMTQEGITFVITNTYTAPPSPPVNPDNPDLPQTGQLWWPVPVLAAVGLLMIVIGLLRRRSAGYEE